MGEVEKLKSSRERRLGLRIFSGQSSAISSTAELERDSLAAFVAHTVELGALVGSRPMGRVARPGASSEFAARAFAGRSRQRNRDGRSGARNSAHRREGGAEIRPAHEKFRGRRVQFGALPGAVRQQPGVLPASMPALRTASSSRPIAQDGDAMQQGYWYTSNRRFGKLEDAESVGVTAAKRALRRLGARKIKTTRAPIVFDPDMAAGLIRSVVGAASGPSLYKGASFLVGQLGKSIAASGVTIIDDALIPGGLGSKPFDGEGLADLQQERGRQGRAHDLSARLLFGAQARPRADRQRRAFGRRGSQRLDHQSVSRAGNLHARGDNRLGQTGLLPDRD